MAYREWLLEQECGRVEYELWTRLAVMRKTKATGFVGWVTYEMKDKESEWNRVTCMLIKFAEYANVGGNRTGGFGVVRLALKS